ncbi:MAG: S9 family peptidase [candidate division KSB1 bacterium]|nr:S9 family peptidase [candidate division KSB1 bacterium]
MNKKYLSFLAVILILINSPPQSESGELLTAKNMLSFIYPTSISLSPNGRQVAFTIRQADFEKSSYSTSIWMVSSEGKELRPFIKSLASDYNPQWSPDSKQIAFQSTRPYRDRDGSEKQGISQIWLIQAGGGEAEIVTTAPHGVKYFQWAPDGKSIAYLTTEVLPVEKQKELQEQQKKKFDAKVLGTGKQKKELWLVDVASRINEKIYTGDYGIRELSFSPDSKTIVLTTNYSGEVNDELNYDLWLVSMADGSAHQLTDFPGPETRPLFSPDGKQIAYLSQTVPDIECAQTDISLIPVTGGPAENLTLEFDFPVTSFCWSPDGHSLYFEAEVKTESPVYHLDLKDKTITPVTRESGCFSNFRISQDGQSFGYIFEDSYTIPEIELTQRKGKPKRITHFSAALEGFRLGQSQVIRWPSRDGWEIEGFLVKPINFEKGKRFPLIVILHGGPFGRFRNSFIQVQYFQLLAANGYLVLAPNPRGSSGYSDTFGQANRYDLAGMDYQDIMAGVDYVINLGIADSSKMGVMGGSYGGYLTNWIISQTNRFQAAVSMYGIFNLVTDWSTSIQPNWEKMFLGRYYWEDITLYQERSPASYVKNINTPVLLLHGEEDRITFISNSMEMYQALKTLGKTVEFVIYPREGHGINEEPNHKIDEMQRVLEWFGRYVKGEG